MDRFVALTRDPIPSVLAELPAPWTSDAASPSGVTSNRGALGGATGAWVEFFGIVRELEESAEALTPAVRIRAIEYEAHDEMALHQLHRILDQMAAQHPLQAFLVIHRLGEVPVGEPSLLVRALSGHRNGALVAVAAFIHEMKQWVPIWKHPIPADENP